MPRRLAQQRMTLSDLEWPFHSSSVPSVWEEHANINALCTSSTLELASSASHAISAVAELLVFHFWTVYLYPIRDAGYLEEGFLALQWAMDSALIEFLSGSATLNTSQVMVRLQRFPFPPYVDDYFVLVIQQQFPFIVMLSFIFCAMQIVRDLVYEKERRLKVLTDVVTKFRICK